MDNALLQSAPARRPFWQTPAVRALLIQCLALLATRAVAAGAGALMGGAASPGVPLMLALAQGVLAALLSWKWLAPWWRLIQLVFPLAVVLTQALQLPPWIFLVGFVCMLLLFWSCFRTQVPYFPSSRASRQAVAALLPPQPIHVVDIGSGFGGLLLQLSASRPESSFCGVEVAPLPWLMSRLRARWHRLDLDFRRQDYHLLDLSQFDVVYCYLSPAAMPALWRKAVREMRPGSLLLSNEFPIPEVPPSFQVDAGPQGAQVYGWRM